jgi:homoserine/homoserine lactone efflux protein
MAEAHTMALDTWLIYLLASIGLSLTPGPNSLLALTHGALYGARRALFTIVGGVFGFSALIALAMFGLTALLQTSASVLTVLKWVGGAYLVWLGIQLWRSPGLQLEVTGRTARLSNMGMFRQGLLSAVANPKVLLFYGAFLPQFIDPQRGLLLQFVIMAVTFASVECMVEYVLARLAFRIRPWLTKGGKGFNRCCGSLFALIGVALPLGR